jgi:SAM-dependent methyltransferase
VSNRTDTGVPLHQDHCNRSWPSGTGTTAPWFDAMAGFRDPGRMTGSTQAKHAIGYEGRIGRYGPELAVAFIRAAGVRASQRALEVGCGSGALTQPLAELLGPENVVAVDPDVVAVEACRARLPGVDVRVAAAEALPFSDSEFDAVLAQLVVSFMSDAHAGVSEMRRVARRGGIVAACSWDFAGGMTLLRTFWDAAIALDPAAVSRDPGKHTAVRHARRAERALARRWSGERHDRGAARRCRLLRF